MACNQCFCLACVRTNTVALVERCGKFQAIKGPGCQCLVWPVDSIVGRVSLRVRQLDVNCETKTKDNVFVNVVICVEIKILRRVLLNHRVYRHAMDATPARWRGDTGSSPLDGARTAASSPRNDLVKNYRVHPTHWLIFTQVFARERILV